MDAFKVMLIAMWLKNGKDYDNSFKAVTNKVNPGQAYIEEAKRYISRYGEDNVVTILEDKYRELGLLKLNKPPLVINLKECN